jgi:hypothetical protein
MRNRLYFGSQDAYQSVARVEENLGVLLAMPPGDARSLVRFWRSTLAPDIQRSVAELFAELQKLRLLPGASALGEPTSG